MKVVFEPVYRKEFYKLLDAVFDSGFLSEGKMAQRFEQMFGDYVGLPSMSVSSGGAALLAILDYINVKDSDVVVPANTFWATPQAVKKAGGNVIYADCNREDLCLSLNDLKKRLTKNVKVVILVHIGGHIAFQVDEIVEFCRERDIYLVEDCAHVHGAWWNGKTGGHYGFAGAYSFYATKTMPLGEGGMVVSKNKDFINWLSKYRSYGKEVINKTVTYPLKNGYNYRLSEITAALGIIQLKRLDKILSWKTKLAKKYDQVFSNHINFPEGMESGYYKYIVYGYPELKLSAGKVFGLTDMGPTIEGMDIENMLPSSSWVAKNHQCLPIHYGWEHADLDPVQLRTILVGSK